MKLLKPIIENLAEHIASSQKGIVLINDLIPYLPLSVSLIETHLDAMVDNTIVFSEKRKGIKTYEFPELYEKAPQAFPNGECVYTGNPLSNNDQWLTLDIWRELKQELLTLAETTAWPAEANWEHELLYITANTDRSLSTAEIAGNSRLTLKQTQERLKELVRKNIATQELSGPKDSYSFKFPAIDYPREKFEEHRAYIKQHPSSLEAEWEWRLSKVLFQMIIIWIACFALLFLLRLPFILLLILGVTLSVVNTWRVLRHREDVQIKPL